MDYNDRVLASLHEAGHCVVSLALGGRVASVTLDNSTRAPGCPLQGRDVAVVSLAGALAARMFGPNAHSYELCRDHSDQDIAVAEYALNLGAGGLKRGGIADIEKIARSVLAPNEKYVRLVAGAIRQAGTLSGADVARICNDEPVDAVLASRSPAPATVGAHGAAATDGKRQAVAKAAAATPPSRGGWRERRLEGDGGVQVVDVLLDGHADYPAAAASYGLTVSQFEQMNDGRPDSYGWCRVSPVPAMVG